MTLEDKIKEFKKYCELTLIGEDYNLVWGEGQFFDYWTEHSPKATKLRWEKEKVFDIKKRFGTWKRNAEKWNKTIVMKPTFVDKVMEKQNELNKLREDLKNEYGDSKAS